MGKHCGNHPHRDPGSLQLNGNPLTHPHPTMVAAQMRMVLITIVTASTNSTLEHTPATNSELQACINKVLAKIDRARASLAVVGGTPSTPSKTLACSVTLLKRGAYLVELDTPESASQFRSYAHDPIWDLAKSCFGDSAQVIDKAYNLIFCLVPCRKVFDPSRAEDITTLKQKNGLAQGSITSTTWLKKVERWHAKQIIASLKVTCNSPHMANHLL
ncbi:hypothetical protein C0993_009192 [Termitomyces sp. T159_Od127]|nr:hypothetical protein C0993_009192 [Termitomyces sp. T159_Od127]